MGEQTLTEMVTRPPMTDLTREQLDRSIAATPPSELRTALEMARRSLDLAAELEKTKADFTAFINRTLAADKRRDELTEERHAIGVTPEAAAWVISKVVEAIDAGPSFRAFIYGLMGFGPESYSTLYMAGGMAFTNAITEAGVDAGVSARRSDRRARRWEAAARIWFGMRRDYEAALKVSRLAMVDARLERDTARRELGEVRRLVEEHRKRAADSLDAGWSTYGDGACDALNGLSEALDALGKEQGR